MSKKKETEPKAPLNLDAAETAGPVAKRVANAEAKGEEPSDLDLAKIEADTPEVEPAEKPKHTKADDKPHGKK